MELLQVSAFPPCQLTQQFRPVGGRFQHTCAPAIFDANSRLYRAFEFLEVGSRATGVSTTAGRIPG
jgi:hypothetical protein